MNKGVINLSLVALRSEPSHTSEMINQLLFGDTVEITGTQDNWVSIKSDYDGYCGWMPNKQLKLLSNAEYEDVVCKSKYVTFEFISQIDVANSNLSMFLFAGTTLAINKNDEVIFGNEVYRYDEDYLEPLATHDSIVEAAKSYLNAPYLWGGRSFAGIDCSGLTQMTFKMNGIKLLRDASQQATQGTTIDFITEAIPGDVLFFDNDEGKIVHTGIYIGANEIIHASGKVRIDTVDHEGIFNKEVNTYTHKLRIIKRMH